MNYSHRRRIGQKGLPIPYERLQRDHDNKRIIGITLANQRILANQLIIANNRRLKILREDPRAHDRGQSMKIGRTCNTESQRFDLPLFNRFTQLER